MKREWQRVRWDRGCYRESMRDIDGNREGGGRREGGREGEGDGRGKQQYGDKGGK